jgi:hypothetical protein
MITNGIRQVRAAALLCCHALRKRNQNAAEIVKYSKLMKTAREVQPAP